MLKLQCEDFTAIFKEAQPLCVRHWEEIGKYKDIWPIKPDMDKYKALYQSNKLRCYTARKDGNLVGYSVYIIDRHLHYSDMIFAKNDLTFLIPEEREGMAGYKLLKYSVEELDKLVPRIVFNVKVYKDFSKVLERLGFEPFEITLDRVRK